MDTIAYNAAFEKLSLAEKTSLHLFDSRVGTYGENLDEEGFLAKMPSLKTLVEPTVETSQGEPPPFVLITAAGDGFHTSNPNNTLRVSAKALRSLATEGIFCPQFVFPYLESHSHFSHRVEYGPDKTTATAIPDIFLRMPRLGRVIHTTMRIRLSDLATVAFISSRVPTSIEALRNRSIRQINVLQLHPVHLLDFVMDERLLYFSDWCDSHWARVRQLERKTGMKNAKPHDSLSDEVLDRNSTFLTDLLRELHTEIVELRLALSTIEFAAGLGASLRIMLKKIDDLRCEINVPPVRAGIKAGLEDQIEYYEAVLKTMEGKFAGLLDRVNAQINVTYSLISQRDSEQNIRIARLTADDSRAMKTITVITLTFLPGTMLASLWDAGIFTLDPDENWRVYVGTTFGLTIVVFMLWYTYMRMSKKRVALSKLDEEVGKSR